MQEGIVDGRRRWGDGGVVGATAEPEVGLVSARGGVCADGGCDEGGEVHGGKLDVGRDYGGEFEGGFGGAEVCRRGVGVGGCRGHCCEGVDGGCGEGVAGLERSLAEDWWLRLAEGEIGQCRE